MVTNFKYGFSLFEALVVMTIAAIFVAVVASVIPHKAKPKTSANAHGAFECYWEGDQLKSRTITSGKEGDAVDATNNDHCVFRPSQYASYLVFNIVGGGSAGDATEGGGAGRFESAFIAIPQSSYNLYPGKGGTVGNNEGTGNDSRVTYRNEDIVTAAGGRRSTNIENTTFDDIVDVLVQDRARDDNNYYKCSSSPRAWLDDNDKKIHVEYCKDKGGEILEDVLTYSDSSCNGNSTSERCYKTILTSPLKGNLSLQKETDNNYQGKNIWQYYEINEMYNLLQGHFDEMTNRSQNCDYDKIKSMTNPFCPSRYMIEIEVNIAENGADGAVSDLTKYAELMQYNELKYKRPGNGGRTGQNGHPGAIVVSW